MANPFETFGQREDKEPSQPDVKKPAGAERILEALGGVTDAEERERRIRIIEGVLRGEDEAEKRADDYLRAREGETHQEHALRQINGALEKIIKGGHAHFKNPIASVLEEFRKGAVRKNAVPKHLVEAITGSQEFEELLESIERNVEEEKRIKKLSGKEEEARARKGSGGNIMEFPPPDDVLHPGSSGHGGGFDPLDGP